MKVSLRVLGVAVVSAVLIGSGLTDGASVAIPSSTSGAIARPAVADSSSTLPVAYQAFLDSVGGSRFIRVDGVRMHYVESGPASRPVLLLLHGSPDSVYSWRKVMPELAKRYHVVAPDLVGFGRSGTPPGPLTWAKEIRYLTAFIQAKHLHDLTMVATDIGGLFAFSYAANHPRNISAIALWETVTAPIPSYDLLGSYCPACVGFFSVPKDPILRQQYIIDNPDFAAQVYGGPGLLHPLSGDELAGYSYFLSTPQQRTNVADIGANMPIAGVPANNYAIAAAFARYLRTSTISTLVLYANPGSILPGSTAIGLGFPHTSYRSVGAGYHFLVEDEPAAITTALLTWRAGLPTAGHR